MMKLKDGKQLVLASKSPRRKALLSEMGYSFRCQTKATEENYPAQLQEAQIAEYLAQKKAEALKNEIGSNEVILASDTVVWCNGKSLEKAEDEREAKAMLLALSGKVHTVSTGVCLLSNAKKEVFSDTVEVTFKTLTEAEIDFYIQRFKPFDKAGAYGIQEWIGMIGISQIKGSYFTVVGLPTHLVYQQLADF